MTQAYLSPILQNAQFSDDGTFLNGGLIWFYATGTSTPLTAYQDGAATTPWPNPIVLNARGETGGEIWLDGIYKLVLQGAPLVGETNGPAISTFDNINGVNAPTSFAPPYVFAGTSTSQSNTDIFMGWNGANLTASQDTTDFGANWPINITGSAGPIGHVAAYAGNVVPLGYLECNGSAVSRTTYVNLFGVCGILYGAGDGTTTFNLPDLRGYFVRGWDDNAGVDVGRVLGSTQADLVGPVTITDPGHTHTDAGHTHSYINNMGGGNGGSSGSASPTGATTGSGVANIQSNTTGILIVSGAETRPKNVAMMYLIKT
jgi:microcystin-dependent protein